MIFETIGVLVEKINSDFGIKPAEIVIVCCNSANSKKPTDSIGFKSRRKNAPLPP